MSAYLTQYIDLGLSVRADDTRDAIAAAEIERLQQLVAVLTAAAQHPRRLGGDAFPEELALDKKRAKRVLHAASQSLTSWKGEPAEWSEAGKIAATLNWQAWWEEHERRIHARQRYIATWCHRYGNSNGDIKWCKSALTKLESELKWIQHALR